MAQRDFLIRSFRVVDQVTSVLKKMSNDKIKVGETNSETKPQPPPPALPPKKLCSLPNTTCTAVPLNKTVQKLPPKENQTNCQSVKGTVIEPPTTLRLQVMCNEATIRVRPDLPASAQWPTLGAKSTKAHIARHFSNTVKIHGLERRLSSEKFISFH
uniref:Uncharacterized protein n=2 Tax=Cuerna arida TaxID=1464854 RepID=A0A1B6GE42_9HEMI